MPQGQVPWPFFCLRIQNERYFRKIVRMLVREILVKIFSPNILSVPGPIDSKKEISGIIRSSMTHDIAHSLDRMKTNRPVR